MEKKEIIFGRNPVLEYISLLNNPEGSILYISKTAHGKIIDTIIKNAKEKGLKVEQCDKNVLAKFEASSKHQGVVLVIPRRKDKGSDREYLEYVHNKGGVLVLLDHLTDPHNVGSIIRTTEALGGDGVVIPKANSSDITSAVIKSSSGATAHLRILTISNVSNFLNLAKKIGFWIIGTSDNGDAELSRLKEIKPSIIIIGSEGSGMRRLTEENCDLIARIPLKGNISSLNASVAAGIVLYEALKI